MGSLRHALAMSFLLVLQAVAAAFPVTSVAQSRETLDRVVARAGSEPITFREVQSLRSISPDLGYDEALRALIDRRLILSWAREEGIAVSAEEVERAEQSIIRRNNLTEEQFERLLEERGETLEGFRDGIRDQLLVNKAMGRAMEGRPVLGEEDIRDYYEATYRPQRTFTISHILLDPPPGDRLEEEVREEAARIMKGIRDGTPFETMAMEYSQDRKSAEAGGMLGTFREGELLPELEMLALSLNAGEIGGPVRSPMGFHILRLERTSLVEPPPLSEVREEIRADLMAGREEEIRDQWLGELRRKTYVEIFSDGR